MDPDNDIPPSISMIRAPGSHSGNHSLPPASDDHRSPSGKFLPTCTCTHHMGVGPILAGAGAYWVPWVHKPLQVSTMGDYI